MIKCNKQKMIILSLFEYYNYTFDIQYAIFFQINNIIQMVFNYFKINQQSFKYYLQ